MVFPSYEMGYKTPHHLTLEKYNALHHSPVFHNGEEEQWQILSEEI